MMISRSSFILNNEIYGVNPLDPHRTQGLFPIRPLGGAFFAENHDNVDHVIYVEVFDGANWTLSYAEPVRARVLAKGIMDIDVNAQQIRFSLDTPAPLGVEIQAYIQKPGRTMEDAG